MNRVVTTKQGRLRGVPGRDEGITVFKGVPYAQPPVGELRWRAPQPPLPWLGIREADHFGPMCVQKGTYFFCPEPFEDLLQSEDSLYLNLWVPAQAQQAAVLVWFHGGAFQGGTGHDPMFDGESFARQGVIVVTLNYRMGIMGCLAHPEMKAESPYGTAGNFGVLDQIAALQWVQENIAAFGGDPTQVTIAGQSAGGGSVCNLITSPLAKGLFARAITESGDAAMPNARPPMGDPMAIGLKLAEALGDGSLASLRRLPFTDLVRADYDAAVALTGQMCTPWIDGVILPRPQYLAMNTTLGNNVPMIVGSNLDEGFIGPNAVKYEDAFAMFGTEAQALAEAYPPGADEQQTMQVLTAVGSAQWKLRLAVLAQRRGEKLGLPTWHYQFCRRGSYGARHSAELAYVYNSFEAYPPKMAEAFGQGANRQLAEAMNAYWANFIKTGNPNGEGLAPWLSKQEAPDQHMRFDDQWGMAPDLAEPREALVLPSIHRAFDSI